MSKLIYIFAACFIPCLIDAASQKSSITSIVYEEDDEPEIDLTPAIAQAYTLMSEADAVMNSIERRTRSNSTGALNVRKSFDNLSETLVYAGVVAAFGPTRESLTQLSNSISDLEKALAELSDS